MGRFAVEALRRVREWLGAKALRRIAISSDPRHREIESNGMSRAKLLLGVLGAISASLGPAAAQPIQLPAGPNREVVSRECQACHDLGMVVAATGLSREGWNSTIDEMISYGMRVDAQDRAKILDYLSSFLGSRSAPNPATR
jgi:hypothetical protein